VKKYEGEKEVLASEVKRHRTALEKHLLDAAATSELAKHSDTPDLLLPHVLKHMRVMEHDGQFVARIVDEAGNVRIGKGQGSAPMTLDELMGEMKGNKTFAPAFRGTGASGGGASASQQSSGGAAGTINRGDDKAFLSNLEAVAKGKVTVV
jgi:hypothetical protein